VGFYHAVPGYVDGQKAFRAVGGYEGAGYLEMPPFGVVLRLSAAARGGFLIQQLNFHGIHVKAGGAFAGQKPVEIDIIDRTQTVKEIAGKFEAARGYLIVHGKGQAEAFGKALFG
jgi:hypothetical protein